MCTWFRSASQNHQLNPRVNTTSAPEPPNYQTRYHFVTDHVVSLSFPTGVLFNMTYHNVTSYLWRRSCFYIDVLSCILLWYRSMNAVLDCLFCRDSPPAAMASSFTRFLDHTWRHTTVGRSLLDEWSSRRKDLYLTTHNTHNIHPCPR